MNKQTMMYLLALAVAVAAPFVGYPVFVMKLLCFGLFACAFNLLIGFTGLLSFGHAAFFGTAGYVVGYLLRDHGWPTEAAIIAAVVASAVIGLAMGALAIRRSGIYFSMITLALAQMVYFGALRAPFTGGEDGLQGVPKGRALGLVDLGNDTAMYFFVLCIVIAAYALLVRIVHSPFGQVLKAIKENEPRATSLGFEVARYKLLAFVLSATLSGLAGATKTVMMGFATLTDVYWTMSGLVILMTLVGGMGTLAGPFIGAIIIISLEEKLGEIGRALASVSGIDWFNTLGESVGMVTGIIFIACVLLFRRGIVGELAAALGERTGRARAAVKGT